MQKDIKNPIKAPELVLSGSFKIYLHQYCHEQDFNVLILLADNVSFKALNFLKTLQREFFIETHDDDDDVGSG